MIRCMGCMGEYTEGVNVCPHCGYVRGTPAREAYHLAPESILAGRYIVGRVLGFGGFGVTYIGWDAQLERKVAIKEFLPTTFATRMPGGTAVTVYEGGATTQFGFGLQRFVEEAQRLAQFNGIPGITDIYDTFSGNNTAYIVMEFLQGRDVKEILAAEGPMPYERARDIVLRVCDTLAPVHARGIIHRDISPDNIYLTDAGEVKLLDFGAARYESSVNSKSLSVILKAGYAPEEQYRSKGDQGPWTDVYALAATMYKMLTGITPPDSMERAVRDEIKEPSKLDVKIPQSAENALMNALNIRKADRIQSAGELKEALQSQKTVERVKAKPRRAQTGRVPVPAIIALALAGVLLVAFVALSATGVVTLPGQTVTNFTADAADHSGMVQVPSLTGKTEAAARAALEEAGLTLELGDIVLEGNAPAGTVEKQQPLSGLYVQPGEAVSVSLNAGTMDEAIASGAIRSPEGMSAVESAGMLANLQTSEYRSLTYGYEYSDSVPAGTVIRYDFADNYWARLWVSAGPNNAAGPGGEARAPFLYVASEDDMYMLCATASATLNADGYSEATQVYLELSAGGDDWNGVSNSQPHDRYGNWDEELEVPAIQVYADNIARSGDAELIGKTLRMRAVQRGSDDYEDETILPMEQTLRVEFGDEEVAVTRHEYVDRAEWEALDESGELNTSLDHLLDMEGNNQMGGVYVYRLFGNFAEGQDYYIDASHSGTHAYCRTTGQLVTYFYGDSFNKDGWLAEFTVAPRTTYGISDDGSEVLMLLGRQTTYELPMGDAASAADTQGASTVWGLGVEEAIDQLLPLMNSDELNVEYVYHGAVPAGQAVSWSGYKEEGQDKYSYITLKVSVGSMEGEPALALGPAYASEDEPFAIHYIGVNCGGREQMWLYYEFSTDGGASWTEEDYYSMSSGGSSPNSTSLHLPEELWDAAGATARLRLCEREGGPALQTIEFDVLPAGEARLSW